MASRNVVNLDALIPREDMAEERPEQGEKPDKIRIPDLEEKSWFAPMLCKPDFQRETAHWTPEKVVDLIRAFLDGDLIPAVILWLRSGRVFVIDGAHRIGALLAWIYDDYGDKQRSFVYFGGQIPKEQIEVAERTRRLVGAQVGHYLEYVGARDHQTKARDDVARRLPRLAMNFLVAQWVPGTDKVTAEESFFKINQAATPLDPTEMRILRSRDAANAVAARAIVRAGGGHKYWKAFASPVQAEIEALGREICDALYKPPMQSGPVKTLDLPVAGRGYNHLPFVFDLVNWANGIQEQKARRKTARDRRADSGASVVSEGDEDGSGTVKALKEVRRSVQRITGNFPGSLGLHPAVYFYTRGGEFQPSAYLAVSEFVRRMDERDGVRQFVTVRERFEDFLLSHKDFITAAIKTTGAGAKSRPRTVRYLDFLVERLAAGSDEASIVAQLQSDPDLSNVVTVRSARWASEMNPTGDFNRATKSAAFINEAVQSAVRCPDCGGLIHRNSMTFDHIKRRREGGATDASNARPMHPVCNTLRG